MAKTKESSSKTEQSLNQSSFDSLVKGLKKALGSSDGTFGETPYYLHSGHYGLDYIISGIVDGSGGWPGGQVVEVFGPRSTGKTLLLIYAIKQMQEAGGITFVADIERRWNKGFAIKHGVDWDKLIGWSPPTVEAFTVNLMDALEELPDNGKVLVTLDSLASLSLVKEVQDQGTKADQGRKAQRLRAAMRVLPPLMSQKGAILMVANHVTDKVGVMYGPTTTTPGGTGVPFQATVRIELQRTQPIKLEGKERPIGVTMNVKCDKNSQTAPFGTTTIDMLWSRGINPHSGLVDMAVDLGIISQNGAWYEWNGKRFKGMKELNEFIRTEPEFLKDPKWSSPYFME